jgi:hypothetical protein
MRRTQFTWCARPTSSPPSRMSNAMLHRSTTVERGFRWQTLFTRSALTRVRMLRQILAFSGVRTSHSHATLAGKPGIESGRRPNRRMSGKRRCFLSQILRLPTTNARDPIRTQRYNLIRPTALRLRYAPVLTRKSWQTEAFTTLRPPARGGSRAGEMPLGWTVQLNSPQVGKAVRGP